jgi:hypothetical protein
MRLFCMIRTRPSRQHSVISPRGATEIGIEGPVSSCQRSFMAERWASLHGRSPPDGDRLHATPYQPLGPVRHQGPLLKIFGPCFARIHNQSGPRDVIFRSSSSRTTIPSRSDDLDAIVHWKRLTALDRRCRSAQSGREPSTARNLCEIRNNSVSDRFTLMRHLFITTGEPSCVPQVPVPCGRP